jgi:dual specificity protein kinase YAK1
MSWAGKGDETGGSRRGGYPTDHRYLILDVLGQGTFGQVVKCQNMRNHEIVAVKVVKNKPAYLNQSKMEVAILELVRPPTDSPADL